MRAKNRSHISIVALFATFVAVSFASCRGPLVWNADLRTFIDDGLSIVNLKSFTVQSGGVTRAVVPSGMETTATLTIDNPRSLKLSCDVRCEDDTLFDSLPIVTVLTSEKISLVFTPSLQAERRDLVLDVGFTAPSINRSYGPEQIVIHCNTSPGSVESSLDAALDENGLAFAAFRLPGSATDDDLSRVEITHRRADGTGSAVITTFAIDDSALLSKKLSVDGQDLLGADDPLNRYFQPGTINSGEDYLFAVVLIDGEGLRSDPAEITSSAALYTVAYNGNGSTSGAVPADPSGYRQTNPVTVLGQSTLERTGSSFAGWNSAPNGSGTAYAAGDTFAIGAGNVTLYAQWAINTYTVSFDSQGGNAVASLTGAYEAVLSLPPAPTRTGYTFNEWNSAADGSGSGYAAGDAFSIGASNVTLYARWAINSYTVSFDSQGGSTVPSLASTYGTMLTLPAGPTRAGYIFTGWNSFADGTGVAYAAGASFTVGANDATLYAQWIEAATVTVTFTINPAYGVITFTSSTVSVVRGNPLELTTSLTGATGWHWYVDDVLDGAQSTSAFVWDTTSVQPGQYIINVDAVYGGYSCTGMIRVTVTY